MDELQVWEAGSKKSPKTAACGTGIFLCFSHQRAEKTDENFDEFIKGETGVAMRRVEMTQSVDWSKKADTCWPLFRFQFQ